MARRSRTVSDTSIRSRPSFSGRDLTADQINWGLVKCSYLPCLMETNRPFGREGPLYVNTLYPFCLCNRDLVGSAHYTPKHCYHFVCLRDLIKNKAENMEDMCPNYKSDSLVAIKFFGPYSGVWDQIWSYMSAEGPWLLDALYHLRLLYETIEFYWSVDWKNVYIQSAVHWTQLCNSLSFAIWESDWDLQMIPNRLMLVIYWFRINFKPMVKTFMRIRPVLNPIMLLLKVRGFFQFRRYYAEFRFGEKSKMATFFREGPSGAAKRVLNRAYRRYYRRLTDIGGQFDHLGDPY